MISQQNPCASRLGQDIGFAVALAERAIDPQSTRVCVASPDMVPHQVPYPPQIDQRDGLATTPTERTALLKGLDQGLLGSGVVPGQTLRSPHVSQISAVTGVGEDRRLASGQDVLLRRPQFGAWLDSQLVDQRFPGMLISLQRLSPAPGARQGEHALGVEALAQGITRSQVPQSLYHPLVKAQPKLSLDVVLVRLCQQLLEPRHERVPQNP